MDTLSQLIFTRINFKWTVKAAKCVSDQSKRYFFRHIQMRLIQFFISNIRKCYLDWLKPVIHLAWNCFLFSVLFFCFLFLVDSNMKLSLLQLFLLFKKKINSLTKVEIKFSMFSTTVTYSLSVSKVSKKWNLWFWVIAGFLFCVDR